MWAEFGVLALIASLCSACLLVSVPMLGLRLQKPEWVKLAGYYAVWQWIFSALAFIFLDICFLLNDFNVVYVRMNSSVALPWFYKMCAIWGGHEGSMLLWVCLLQTWTLAVAIWSKALKPEMRARVLVVMGALSIAFLTFILLTSNPFLQVFQSFNVTGRDLNPLLQDPGFLFHPPMLYMGYVGFSVAFAFAIATLWAGEFDSQFVKWTRPWVLVAWCCLTLGITLGSWWAYRELGWGGFWFWDPVENASFMPWLVSTALIHSLLVSQKRHALVAWVLFLSIIVFSLSLVGTFLVRSGVLSSVHAFAVDPSRGLAILIMLGLAVGGSLTMYAYRAKTVIADTPIKLFSREMTLLLNNVFLVVGMLTVLLGTLYPLIIDALGRGKISVGAPYFNLVFVPLMLPLCFLMGLAVWMPWGEVSLRTVFIAIRLPMLMTVLILLGGMLFISSQLITWLGIALAFWVAMTTIQALWYQVKQFGWRGMHGSRLGMSIAHLGVACSVLGVAVSTGFGTQTDDVLAIGQTIPFAGYEIKLEQVDDLHGPNYHGVRGTVRIQSAHTDKRIYPEKRIYDVGQIPMTDAAVDVNPLRDIYVALGEQVGEQTWGLRLYDKPLVRWIWLGGLMMCLGGVLAWLSCLQKRK